MYAEVATLIWFNENNKHTFYRVLLLQQLNRAGESVKVLQTRLAGRAHWPGALSEVAVSLG